MIEIEIDKSVYLECYHDILDCDDDVLLLWGGREGGKSKYIAQRLIEKCLSASYFKCILVKKSYESIKESQYEELKKAISEWGLDELFEFRVSPLEIICANGNRFIARGCDKPEKMKSIKDPTDAWYEEGNQITEEDYITISTTLRSNEVKTQEWLSFNPEHDGGKLEDFWIYKMFFKGVGHNNKNFSHTTEVKFKQGEDIVTSEIKYTSKHTTYRDNPYVPAHRKAKLENMAASNPYYHAVFALGEWGEREINNPFCTQFDKDKHESTTAVFRDYLNIIISFDFNIDPFAVNFYHMWKDAAGYHIHQFDEMSIKSGSIPKMCEMIKQKYGHKIYSCFVSGDGTSRKRDISQKDNASHYQQIQNALGLKPQQFKVTTNPLHENSREDVNYLLSFFPDIKFNPTSCPNTCRDMKSVEADEFGHLKKKQRSDVTQQADHMDAFRYFVNSFCRPWIQADQKARYRK